LTEFSDNKQWPTMLMKFQDLTMKVWFSLLQAFPQSTLAWRFGALLTLQFSLTAAPASQPRNVICGQLLSLSLAALGQCRLRDVLPVHLLVPAIAALAISVLHGEF
jgi:CBS-domain-containing membrane protein